MPFSYHSDACFISLMRAFGIGLLVVVLACASTQRHEEALNTWIGTDVNELIQAWGPPASTFEMPDGRKMYSWYYDGGVVAVPIGSIAVARRRDCQTTFTVSTTGRVELWRYVGNAC